MASASKGIDQILQELEDERSERDRPLRVDSATDYARADVITSSLRSLEQSLNAVKRARGEPPVEIVGSGSDVEESVKEDIASLAGQLDLPPAAVTATLGVRLWEKGEAEKARPLLEAAADADDPMAAGTLGLLLEKAGETGRALDSLEKAAKSGDPQARYTYARVLADNGQAEKAIPLLIDNPDVLAPGLLARLRSERGE
ncbi:MAG: tetratricopeptide repeat protein [Solirubrobacteraceae bacterium]|jgi:tetratricopeptide (TPR) repeat protein